MEKKFNPPTLDCFEVIGVEVKRLKGSSHSGNHETSSSRAILTGNGWNGSASTKTPDFATFQVQHGKRMDKILGLVQNQVKTLADQGASIRTYLGALTTQGNTLTTQGNTLTTQGKTLETHGEAIVQLLKGQQELQEDVARVENQVGRKFKEQDAKLKMKLLEQERKLEAMQDRIDKLSKRTKSTKPCGNRPVQRNPGNRPAQRNPGNRPVQRNPGNRPAQRNPGNRPLHQNTGNLPVRRSSRLGAQRVQEAAVSAKPKYEQVRCSYCRTTLSSSYIRHHMKRCPVFRRGQEESG